MKRRALLSLPLVALFAPLAAADPSIGQAIVRKRVAERLACDGKATAWTLAKTPAGNEYVDLYLNGMLLWEGIDYTLDAQTVTWKRSAVPTAADILGAKYWAEFIA